MVKHALLGIATFSIGLLVGCGGGDTGGSTDEAQVSPTSSADDIEAWLAAGHYKQWSCEDSEHDARSPSPHGVNRICSNDVLSTHGDGEFPVDSVGVKELWDAIGGKVIGYAVYRHTKAGTTGDTWHWYERVPLDSAAPHDDKGVVAFGLGASGAAKDICVGCHQAAGSDMDHGGHDFVYTQVK